MWAFTMGLIIMGQRNGRDGGGRSDLAAAARHMVTHFGHTHTLSLLSHNLANFKPKIMILRSLKSSQTGVFFHILWE